MSEFPRHTETFIVRLWAEHLEQMPPVWRGEIEHVGSKEVMHFGSFDEMNAWIRCRVTKRSKSHGKEKEK